MTPGFTLHLEKIEIRHHAIELFVPDPEQVRKQYPGFTAEFPYWSKVWPASLAMADFLLVNPSCIFQKQVLELGAGLGLPSLVAAPQASQVICSDVVPAAVEAMELSVKHNHFDNVSAQLINWESLPENLHPGVVLLSDINYDPMAFSQLDQVIRHFLDTDTTIILSTPQRLMAKSFIASLMPYCIQHQHIPVPQEGQQVMNTVLVLSSNSAAGI